MTQKLTLASVADARIVRSSHPTVLAEFGENLARKTEFRSSGLPQLRIERKRRLGQRDLYMNESIHCNAARAPYGSTAEACVHTQAVKTHRMNALVLDEELPHPPNSGKRIRTWNILSRLAKRHSVTLLCYGAPHDPGIAALNEAGIRAQLINPKHSSRGLRLYSQLLLNLFSPEPFSVTKHYSDRFQQVFTSTLKESSWDVIHCEWTPYARYVSQVQTLPVVISAHNIESDIWYRRSRTASSLWAKAFFWTQEWKMRRFEQQMLVRATAVTAVTDKDLQTMKAWGVTTALLAPNGVDLNGMVPSHELENDNEILFLASLDWHANVDSLEFFTSNVLNRVLALNPRARLRIVGRRPSESLVRRYLSVPAVDFTGEVSDVQPFLARAAVVVVPLRIGGGSRIKILEALASEKAVVATSVGAEGLDVVAGEHLMIADTPEQFAECILQLQASKNVRIRLGRNGRRLVEQVYSWDGIADRVEAAWFAAVQLHGKHGINCGFEPSS